MPPELEWLNYGDRFGYQAVFGRWPSPGEMRRMVAAQNIANAYQARSAAPDWSKWALDNPETSEALNMALKEAVRLGLIDGE